MKKLFYIVLIIGATFGIVYGLGTQQSYFQSEVATFACSQGSTTDFCTTSSGQYSLSTFAYGFTFDLASQQDIHGLWLRINDSGASGTVTVRIGTGADLTSAYIEQVTGVVVDSSDVANYEYVQFSTCQTLSAGTYYVGVLETAGDVRFQRYPSDTCSNMNGRYASAGDIWNMANSNAEDPNWKYDVNGG